MNETDQKLLFIIGGQKSGTSTMVGILNCHPEVFVMHEWFIDQVPSKYGHNFYRAYRIPEKYRVNKRKAIFKNFLRLRSFVSKKQSYRYFGDKWPRLRGGFDMADKRIGWLENHHVIYVVRDLRTWLCHPKIQSASLYSARDDVVSPATWYVYYFVRSFKLKNCLRVRMEDFIEHEKIVNQIDEFLPDIDCSCMHNWWEKVGKYDDFNKNLHEWWTNHKSSLVKPTRFDVDVRMKEHPFWDEILPIFDKYYNSANGNFSDAEIDADLMSLRKLYKLKPITTEECYEQVTVEKVK